MSADIQTEMQERLASGSLDKYFGSLECAVESMCQRVVFRGDQDNIDVLVKLLKKHQEAILDIVKMLVKHLDKDRQSSNDEDENTSLNEEKEDEDTSTISEPVPFFTQPATGPPAYPSSMNSRMAASFTGMPYHPAQNAFPGFPDPSRPSAVPAWLQNNQQIYMPPNIRHQSQNSKLDNRSLDKVTPPSSVASDSPGDCQPKKIFVVNLDRKSTAQSVAKYFGSFGTVADVKIFRFPSGESRGMGAVEFVDDWTAKQVIGIGSHWIDDRQADVKPFYTPDKLGARVGRRFQIFLGGVPSHLTREEVVAAVGRVVKFRELRLNSERGYAYLGLESEVDARRLIDAGFMRIGEKMVECKENMHNRT